MLYSEFFYRQKQRRCRLIAACVHLLPTRIIGSYVSLNTPIIVLASLRDCSMKGNVVARSCQRAQHYFFVVMDCTPVSCNACHSMTFLANKTIIIIMYYFFR